VVPLEQRDEGLFVACPERFELGIVSLASGQSGRNWTSRCWCRKPA